MGFLLPPTCVRSVQIVFLSTMEITLVIYQCCIFKRFIRHVMFVAPMVKTKVPGTAFYFFTYRMRWKSGCAGSIRQARVDIFFCFLLQVCYLFKSLIAVFFPGGNIPYLYMSIVCMQPTSWIPSKDWSWYLRGALILAGTMPPRSYRYSGRYNIC